MARIVIEMPEDTIKAIKDGNSDDYNIPLWLCYSIANGIILPKGHGRLIDADALKKDDEVTIWRTRDSLRTGKTLKFFSELFVKKIEDAPTVIEADKAESEVNK